jgi:hypothetical protein|tara:strand:- start:265 stop:462 length:198 start_codon:yes stop_codon:yes gene_type:complete
MVGFALTCVDPKAAEKIRTMNLSIDPVWPIKESDAIPTLRQKGGKTLPPMRQAEECKLYWIYLNH